MSVMLNILIRTSNRPTLFARCLASVQGQTYQNYRIIVGYDDDTAQLYIPDELEQHYMTADISLPYYYDCYCNELKQHVTSGWFLFLDDDDILTRPAILEELVPHLKYPYEAIICQFLRNGNPKPPRNYIRNKVVAEGKIGLPCLVLHSKHKTLSGLDGQKAGDYRYIKEIVASVPTKFIELPLVDAGARGHGKMEQISQLTENSRKFENK